MITLQQKIYEAANKDLANASKEISKFITGFKGYALLTSKNGMFGIDFDEKSNTFNFFGKQGELPNKFHKYIKGTYGSNDKGFGCVKLSDVDKLVKDKKFIEFFDKFPKETDFKIRTKLGADK